MFVIGYAIQIVFLVLCLGMALRMRRVLGGMWRGILALLVLLIVHSVEGIYPILGEAGNFILSSSVVFLITFDLYYVYRQRAFYEAWHRARQRKEQQLEQLRTASEKRKSWESDLPARWL